MAAPAPQGKAVHPQASSRTLPQLLGFHSRRGPCRDPAQLSQLPKSPCAPPAAQGHGTCPAGEAPARTTGAVSHLTLYHPHSPFQGCSGSASAGANTWVISLGCFRHNESLLPPPRHLSQPAGAGAALGSHTRQRAGCKLWFWEAHSPAPHPRQPSFRYRFHFVCRAKRARFSPRCLLSERSFYSCFLPS